MKNWLLWLAPLCLAACSIADGESLLDGGGKPPNFVIILADDLGYGDIQPFGQPAYETPNLAALARDGIKFTAAYVTSAVCSPSRAGLLTGIHQEKLGFSDNPYYTTGDPEIGLPQSVSTIADYLGDAGYTSAAIGKWHLGATLGHHPMKRGFDRFYGFLGGGHRYLADRPIAEKYEYVSGIYDDWTRGSFEGHLTDRFTDAAVDFIQKNSQQPFFIYLAYNAPHGPFMGAEEDLVRLSDMPEGEAKQYAALVIGLDRSVGRLRTALKDAGVEDNTLIIFMSDNGAVPPGTNAPLRGIKGMVTEGGIRIPFIASWKGVIEPGQTVDTAISALDLAPTLLDLAGRNPKKLPQLDGVSLSSILRGRQDAAPKRPLFWKMTRWGVSDKWAVRDGDWKLLRDYACKVSLYNLKDDPGELNDLSSDNVERVADLFQAYEVWNENNPDALWRFAYNRDVKLPLGQNPEFGCPDA